MKICLRDNVIHKRDDENKGILSVAQRQIFVESLQAVLIKKNLKTN